MEKDNRLQISTLLNDVINCPHCDAFYTEETIQKLIEHIRETHTALGPHACWRCDVVSKTTNDFILHLLLVHPKERNNSFGIVDGIISLVKNVNEYISELGNCPHCTYPYTASSVRGMRQHIRRQHPEVGTFNCWRCGASYEEPRDLIGHLEDQHIEERAFSFRITQGSVVRTKR